VTQKAHGILEELHSRAAFHGLRFLSLYRADNVHVLELLSFALLPQIDQILDIREIGTVQTFRKKYFLFFNFCYSLVDAFFARYMRFIFQLTIKLEAAQIRVTKLQV